MDNPPGYLEAIYNRLFKEKGMGHTEAIVMAQAEYNLEADMKVARETKVAPPWIADDVRRRKLMGLPFEQALEAACADFIANEGYEPLISVEFQEHQAGAGFTNLD